MTWLPFELHPEAPVEGIPYEAYFGRSRSLQMRSRLEEVAEEVGLVMKRRDVIINSRRALSAAEFARDQGKFDAMHKALFKAHWEGTGRLENADDLVRIGTEQGLDPVELRTAIDEGRYEGIIDDNRLQAESVGINAIPAHIFGNRYLVVGAHPYESFTQVLDRLRQEKESSPQ
ncbi:MAG: DsbA family protein [Candidatus Dormibacteraeota bacterium]|nr:DsbA family protein [Candidatus Dormibacteraeota bacterium]